MSDPDPLLDASNDPPSTDSEAVQNLISALRASLTSTQTLLNTQTARLTHLGDVETELVKLKDQHAFVVAAKEAVEVQLKEEVKRREVAEEMVEALRGQVEAARRGVMTLQKQEKERKRMSTMGGLGLGGVGEEEEVLNDLASGGGGGKDRSKRQSILKSHRRISSQSEPDAIYASPSAAITSPAPTATPTMPQPQQPARPGLREFKLGTAASITGPSTPNLPNTSTSPRPLFAQQEELLSSPVMEPSIMSATTSLTSNQEETHRLRGEINLLQSQLVQAEEAREASENCLKALREFIASSPGGGGTDSFDKQLDLTSADLVGIRLPPLPTDRDPDEPPTPPAKEEKKLGASGWGLGKLWKTQATAPAASPRSTAVEPSTPGLLSPGASVRSLPHRSSSPTSFTSPLPPVGDATEDKVNALAGSSTPLSSFVASWTKTVPPGTPAAMTPGASGGGAAETRPSNARGFSGFWGRKKEDRGKDLPEAPETESQGQSALDPSPMIEDGKLDAGQTEVEGEALVKEAEVGQTTPKQLERDCKELEAVNFAEPAVEEGRPDAEAVEEKKDQEHAK